MFEDYKIILIVISLFIYFILIQYRYKLYFIPDKIILYNPDRKYDNIFIDNINAWLIYESDVKKNNIIIYFHGNAGNISNRLNTIDKLFNIMDDTDILIFDYPEFGLSTGSLNINSVIESGFKVWNYVKNVLKYDNIILLGESIGAGIVAEVYLLIKKYSDKQPKGIIHLNGMTSMKDMARLIIPSYLHFLILFWITEFNTCKIYCENLDVKLNIIHSIEDETIPYEYAVNLYNSLLRCKKDVYLIKISGNHNIPLFDDNMKIEI
jgi:hypothetical protein